MPHDIIDNQSVKLVEVLNNTLPSCQSTKIAVGYFFLSGLEVISDSLFNVKEIRLLVGSITNNDTIEEILEGQSRLNEAQHAFDRLTHPNAARVDEWINETANKIGEVASVMPQTDASQHVIYNLSSLITNERIKVRIYTKGRLHAKAYILDYGQMYDAAGRPLPLENKGLAIVGSSNFTLSGLTHNSELNVKIYGDANHEELTKWFNRLWEESKDFKPQLLQELQQSWALVQVTPYMVYLKALYEFVKDRLSEEAQKEFLWQSEITTSLAEFQINAVKRTIQIIRQYGGAFVSDVVGLGKSFIGSAIVKHFERYDRCRPLIICPQSLVRMWERYNERYQLNARVLSSGMLREDASQPGYNILMDDEMYQDRDFVLIDESHNYRNPEIQRYKILQTYLQSGDRKCVLLTATPRNKNMWDIYHQIKLFHAGEITHLPIDPPILKDFVKKVESRSRKAASLLSNIMVRRTRMDVLRWYGYDAETDERINPFDFEPYHTGEKKAYIKVGECTQFFPKRQLQTIEYNIEETYSGLYDNLLRHIGRPGEQFVGDPEQLIYARYGIWHYVKAEKQDISPYNELQRAGINLRGLVRIFLFKRFESSVDAFRKTLTRMIASHRAFLESMLRGFIPAGEKAGDLLSEAGEWEMDELLDELLKVADKKYRVEDFEMDKLMQDVEHDLDILEKMKSYVDPITPEDDDKLLELRKWLTEPKGEQPALASKKCIIFTQFADTARYLYENINDILTKGIDVIYGQEKDKMIAAWRFSPRSNQDFKPSDPHTEIRLLIATDVMSEGLNLQDCDQIVNYDLHWNPVKLIQRFGRIDRIGTTHSMIFGYNFLPEKSLEEGLGLKEKLVKRISEIQNMLGGDAAILDPSEKFQDQAFIAIYQGQPIDQFDPADEEEDLVDLTEAEEFMRQLKIDNPDFFNKIAKLKDGIRAVSSPELTKTYVVCRAGEYRQIYSVDQEGTVQVEDIPSALGQMKCDLDTPGFPIPKNYNQNISSVQHTFENHINEWRARTRITPAMTLAQRYVKKELESMIQNLFIHPDLHPQIHLYINAFSHPLISAVQHELNAIRRNQVKDKDLLDQLERIYIRYQMKNIGDRLGGGNNHQGVPTIVCSMGK